MSPESRIEELGYTLPEQRSPGGNYVSAVQTGNLLFLAGSLSYDTIGKLGDELTAEDGYEAAKQAGLEVLSKINDAVGSLDRVSKIVKVVAFINSNPTFNEHAKVVDGASDLFVDVFGKEIGTHVRVSVGASTPRQAAIELEVVVEIKED